MDALRRLSLLILVFAFVPVVQAQGEVPLLTPVSGSIRSGETAQWSFAANDGAMLSFRLEATSGDLDPQFSIADNNGAILYQNDDINYPENTNAGLEGVTIPHTGTYTLTVSGVGTTSGDYSLSMLPGYAVLSDMVDFEAPDTWRSEQSELAIFTGNNRIALELDGTEQNGIASYSGGDATIDQYIRVEGPEIDAQNDWHIGLVTRYQDGSHYYAFLLRGDGFWQFMVQTDDGSRVIRDWSSHPAVVPGAVGFSLGLLTNGSSFEFFYNDQLIGTASDDTLLDAGETGLIVATGIAPGSEITAQFENLSITTPTADTVPVQQMLSGASTVVVPALQRRRLIPSGGQVGLLVPESFVTFNHPGVNTLLLGGSDQQFRNFVLGTTVSWEISTPNLPAGCGLMLRAQDDADYLLAYVDQTGGYGLSARQGDSFAPGIFGESLPLNEGQHRLLIIADEGQLLYYVDGQLAGTLESAPITGRVGNAVVNFEAVTTSCQFTETWVWTWN